MSSPSTANELDARRCHGIPLPRWVNVATTNTIQATSSKSDLETPLPASAELVFDWNDARMGLDTWRTEELQKRCADLECEGFELQEQLLEREMALQASSDKMIALENELAAVKGEKQLDASPATDEDLSLPDAETSSFCSQMSIDNVDCVPKGQDGLKYALSQGSLNLSDFSAGEDEQYIATFDDTEYDGGESDAETHHSTESHQTIEADSEHVLGEPADTFEFRSESYSPARRGPPLEAPRFDWRQDVWIAKSAVLEKQRNIREVESDGCDNYEIDGLDDVLGRSCASMAFSGLLEGTDVEVDDSFDEQYVADLLDDHASGVHDDSCDGYHDDSCDGHTEYGDWSSADDEDVYEWHEDYYSKNRYSYPHNGRKVRFSETDIRIEYSGNTDNESGSTRQPLHDTLFAKPFQPAHAGITSAGIRPNIYISPRSRLVDPSPASCYLRSETPIVHSRSSSARFSEHSGLASPSCANQKVNGVPANPNLQPFPKISSDRAAGTFRSPRPQDSWMNLLDSAAGAQTKTNHMWKTPNYIQQGGGAPNPNEALGFATGCAWFAPFRQPTHTIGASNFQVARVNSIRNPTSQAA